MAVVRRQRAPRAADGEAGNMSDINADLVGLSDGYGAELKAQADRIVDALGNDPGIALNAIVFVLGILIGSMKAEYQDRVIDGIPDNIRLNMGAKGRVQ